MSSKRSHEGYLLIDSRFTPGFSDLEAIAAGLPVGAGRGVFEAPTYTCSHCQYVVVINPARNRERAHCRKCDHYICDACGAALALSGICRTFKQVIYEIQERADKAPQQGNIILSP